MTNPQFYIPLSSGLNALVLSVAIIVLWLRHRQRHILWLGSSFLLLGFAMTAFPLLSGGLAEMWRAFLGPAILVSSMILLAGGCIGQAGRQVWGGWLLLSGTAYLGGVLIVVKVFQVHSVTFNPSLFGIVYLVISYFFFASYRGPIDFFLAILFVIRAGLMLPWFWLDWPARHLIQAIDPGMMLAIGLALIINQLSLANRQLARQAIELSELNRQIRQKHEAALLANKAKTDFLANMSHELRTPLNAIIGFADMIANRVFGSNVDRYVDYGGDIRSAGNHLHRIINDVLDMSRIEAGRTEVHPEKVDIRCVLDSALTLTRHQGDTRKIGVDVDIDDGAAEIETDPQLLKQVLINLLSNAFKFTADGGHVGVSVSTAGGRIEFRVSDDGVGIPASDLENIFQPFGVTGVVEARTHGGIGLGLSITSKLVHLLKGEIGIESEVGRGTTVRFSLPRIS